MIAVVATTRETGHPSVKNDQEAMAESEESEASEAEAEAEEETERDPFKM